MADKKEIYPKGIVKQGEEFADAIILKDKVYELIKELLKDTTETAFKSAGYKGKVGYAGVYGNEVEYGKGVAKDEYNVFIASKTKSYFEKHIAFGGKKTISEIHMDIDGRTQKMNITYHTTEQAAFRGYADKAGAFMMDAKLVFDLSNFNEFKKEIKKELENVAAKEVAYITKTKLGVEDKVENSINSMVENMAHISLKDILDGSFEDTSSKIDAMLGESKKEDKEDKNHPDVIKANSPGNLLFDELDELEEGDYKELVKYKLKKWQVASPKELKPSDKKSFFDELDSEWKSKEEKKIEEITSAGSYAVGAIGGQPVDGTVGTAGTFKYAANPFMATPYAQMKNKKPSVKKTKKEGESFWSEVELNPGSGYVPKGMEHNWALGQHDVKVGSKEEEIRAMTRNRYYKGKGNAKPKGKMNEGVVQETGEWDWSDVELKSWADSLQSEIQMIERDTHGRLKFIEVKGYDKDMGPYAWVEIDGKKYKMWTTAEDMLWIENYPMDNTSKLGNNLPGFQGDHDEITNMLNFATLNEEKRRSLKRKFVSESENSALGVNKRYIITPKLNEEEEKERWKELIGIEINETIKKAENIISENCACPTTESDYVTRDTAEDQAEEQYEKRNTDAEVGEMINGKKVVMVPKPDSVTGVLFKVYEEDYLNESKSYLLDMTTGNYVLNPKFKSKK